MPIFRDREGTHYDIPSDALEEFVVRGELPEDAELSGEERHDGSTVRHEGGPGAPVYLWPPVTHGYFWDSRVRPGPGALQGNPGALGAAAHNYPAPGLHGAGAAYNYAGQAPFNYAAGHGAAYNYAAGHGAAYNYAAGQSGAYNYGAAAAYNYVPEPAYNYAAGGAQGAAYSYGAEQGGPATYNYTAGGAQRAAYNYAAEQGGAAAYNYVAGLRR